MVLLPGSVGDARPRRRRGRTVSSKGEREAMERIVRSGRLRPGACDRQHRATMYRDPALDSGATIQPLESSWAEWIAPFIVEPPGPAAWRALAGAWRDPRGAPDGAARSGAAARPCS